MKICQLNEAAHSFTLDDDSVYTIDNDGGEPVFRVISTVEGDFSAFAEAISEMMANHDESTITILAKGVMQSTKGLPHNFTGSLVLSTSTLGKFEDLHWFQDELLADHCSLTTLEGVAEQIHRIDVDYNQLTTLAGGPHTVYEFHAVGNKLSNFEGAPTNVSAMMILNSNRITEFSGQQNIYVNDEVHLERNKITSLRGLDKVFARTGHLILTGNPVTKHVLTVFKTEVDEIYLDDKKLASIINTHLKQGGNKLEAMLDCQEALIDAGYSQECASL